MEDIQYLLVLEKELEGNDLYHEMIESGVIKPGSSDSKAALVYGQMNEPPGAKARVEVVRLTMAEYFRDERQDVLFLLIIYLGLPRRALKFLLYRKNPISSRISAYSSHGYGSFTRRITSTNKGSITSVQAIYVPADDLTDPAPATSFNHLDATTVLSRQIAELGIYPAVNPLDSSRI